MMSLLSVPAFGTLLSFIKEQVYYDRNYYTEGIAQNPKGPRIAVRKVIRGGSWVTSEADLWRATNREAYSPTSAAHNVGFRCASDHPPIQLEAPN